MDSRCIWEDESLSVYQLPVLQDNYVYVLRAKREQQTAVVDPSVTLEVDRFLQAQGWTLDLILHTHHHGDHIGGTPGLLQRYRAAALASHFDSTRIPGLSRTLGEGDTIAFGSLTIEVRECPGHTLGHILYVIREKPLLFCGDTLFALGCGRLFEGTADQMWTSLKKLEDLSQDTLVCCAHEYTLANARFVESLGEDRPGFASYWDSLKALRAQGLATVPTRLEEERRWNPFLSCPTGEDFARVRRAKDEFRS